MMKEKVQSTRKQRLFGLFATITMVLGIGVSLSNKEPLQTKAAETLTYTFSSDKWETSGSDPNWTSNKDGAGFTNNQGVQVTKNSKSASATSPISYSNITSITVGYTTNASSGVGSIKVYSLPTANGAATQIGSTFSVTKPSSGGTTVKNTTNFITSESSIDGYIKVEGLCTTNSVYINNIAITYETRTVRSIAIEQEPTKLHYYVGEELDKMGLIVKTTYSDNTIETVNNNDITVTPATMAIDTTSVVLSYGGKDVTLSGISVEAAPTVESLTVTGKATKTSYFEGETFNPDGLTVIANLSNGTTKDVKTLATYEPNPLTTGTT